MIHTRNAEKRKPLQKPQIKTFYIKKDFSKPLTLRNTKNEIFLTRFILLNLEFLKRAVSFKTTP